MQRSPYSKNGEAGIVAARVVATRDDYGEEMVVELPRDPSAIRRMIRDVPVGDGSTGVNGKERDVRRTIRGVKARQETKRHTKR